MTRRRDKRQRNNVLQTRANDEERDAIKARADRLGLSVGTLLRQLALSLPMPARAVRYTRLEINLIVQAIGELGKIGSNINQYAKSRNMGRESDSLDLAMEAACRDILEMRLPFMQALGQEPRRRKDIEPDDSLE
jgi:hypothetical protein